MNSIFSSNSENILAMFSYFWHKQEANNDLVMKFILEYAEEDNDTLFFTDFDYYKHVLTKKNFHEILETLCASKSEKILKKFKAYKYCDKEFATNLLKQMKPAVCEHQHCSFIGTPIDFKNIATEIVRKNCPQCLENFIKNKKLETDNWESSFLSTNYFHTEKMDNLLESLEIPIKETILNNYSKCFEILLKYYINILELRFNTEIYKSNRQGSTQKIPIKNLKPKITISECENNSIKISNWYYFLFKLYVFTFAVHSKECLEILNNLVEKPNLPELMKDAGRGHFRNTTINVHEIFYACVSQGPESVAFFYENVPQYLNQLTDYNMHKYPDKPWFY